MREIVGDLFNYQLDDASILRCVTTNGVLNKNQELVMGAGVALRAKILYPNLPKILGELVLKHGNHVHLIENIKIASFPTKHDWKDPSDLQLIEQSCQELVEKEDGWDYIVLPRVGAGMGRLAWSDVRQVLEKYFDSDKYLILVQ